MLDRTTGPVGLPGVLRGAIRDLVAVVLTLYAFTRCVFSVEVVEARAGSLSLESSWKLGGSSS